MLASPGDWIIKGVKGEFYPCKPDIFNATYTPGTATPMVPAVTPQAVRATRLWQEIQRNLCE
jgi:hypothetical protein